MQFSNLFCHLFLSRKLMMLLRVPFPKCILRKHLKAGSCPERDGHPHWMMLAPFPWGRLSDTLWFLDMGSPFSLNLWLRVSVQLQAGKVWGLGKRGSQRLLFLPESPPCQGHWHYPLKVFSSWWVFWGLCQPQIFKGSHIPRWDFTSIFWVASGPYTWYWVQKSQPLSMCKQLGSEGGAGIFHHCFSSYRARQKRLCLPGVWAAMVRQGCTRSPYEARLIMIVKEWVGGEFSQQKLPQDDKITYIFAVPYQATVRSLICLANFLLGQGKMAILNSQFLWYRPHLSVPGPATSLLLTLGTSSWVAVRVSDVFTIVTLLSTVLKDFS